ncbi:putative pentatricopeptide repeat-containing protein At5g06400, mitochondrial [Ipomoea triloba]|uniref:putative pentatricopeptide repeat-containing protein At5g06400, mitochondrial n=1 Tax=Ipomoea triloba TaxID=35885 RepID=UPI00125CEC6E|nr:putative pentatricopeptide repeat-containing protein At5g06400, mitochondrial [Ipomoea triloba]
MMKILRFLSILELSTTVSRNNLFRLHQRFQLFTLSFDTKSYKLQKSKKTRESEAHNLNSLFNEIRDILESGNVRKVEKQSGFTLPGRTQPENVGDIVQKAACTLDVCGNAEENEEFLSSNDKQMGVLGALDVSPIVHKITEIVRDENDAVSMEERLKNASLEYTQGIVEMVLKRCFKVPHLALRFFNWVKSVEGFSHSTETYNVMIYMAAEAKDFGLVDKLLEEMENNSCEHNLKTWSIIISHCGHAKLIGKALLVFEKMKKNGPEPDTLAHKLMLNALCNAGKADIALEFYKEMSHQGMVLDERLFKKLLKCLAVSGDSVAAHRICDDMMSTLEISEHEVYGFMLRNLCNAGRIREALELIREMMKKNVSLDSENFEALVNGLCKADRINDALEIVDIMKKRSAGNENLYKIIVCAFLSRNELSKALDLMQSVKESGHLPTTATYTALMQRLFRANEFQKGVDLYHEMMERGVRLDCMAFTAVIAGYIRQNCVSEAWGVFKSMKEKGISPSRKSYSIFIKELLKVSGTNDILKFMKEMKDSKMEPGDDIFQQVTSYLRRKGEMNKLKEIEQMQGVSSLLEARVELNTAELGPASKSCHQHGVCEISQILSSSMDWCFVNEQLEKCSIRFTPELVTEILRNSRLHSGIALRFFSWAGKRSGYRHTTESYHMAIKIAGQAKDFKEMRSLFYEMRRKRCLITCNTWTIMIMQYGRTGLTDIALRTFREMKDGDHRPTETTYKFLIICLCGKKGRNIDEAIKLFHEMIEMDCRPDKELAEAYLDCLCEAGKLGDARSCIESLQKTGFSIPLSYSLYVRSLCRVGRLEEALGLIAEFDDDQHTLAQYTHGSIIHGLLQKGDLKTALAKIESMKQLGIQPTIHTYTSLIVYYFKEKQIEKVLACLEEMKESGCEPTLVTYSALLRGYINTGNVTDAWSVFQHIKQNGPFPDFKTYSIFISCLCRIGKSEEALQLISEMMNTGIVPSAVNFRTVFYGLNREGKRGLAQYVLQKKSHLKRMRKLSI